MNKKVLVFGTFDGLHKGHKDFLTQAKKYGDNITAVIARDETVEQVKHKKPRFNETTRQETIKPYVNQAKLGTTKKNKAEIILDIKPDVICLGYDQTHFIKQLHELIKEQQLNIQIKTLKPYMAEKYKSSLLNNTTSQQQ